MSKSVLRGMIKKRSGRIISITSVVGAMGNAGQSNYAASKAGMIGFTKSLAREVGVRNITVNAIAPGFIETDMTDSLPEEQKEVLASQIPMGRLGTADEVAQAVLFLAADSGSYVTGQTLHINGGMYLV
jgi:3-oxoacyl-[acyl-carrier protein] reductase